MKSAIRFALLIALACGAAPPGRAQTITNVIDRFNTNTYPNGSITNTWQNWFGSAFQSLSLDPTNDANGNPASGSLKIVANFPVNNQFTVWNGYSGISPALNGLLFTNLQCDVRFAPGSATMMIGGSNTFGTLQFGMGTPTWGQDYFVNGNIVISATNTNWVHVSIPLNVATDTNLYNIANVFIHMWSGTSLSGPSTLWVDNLQFVGSAITGGTIALNATNLHQTIEGFGGATVFYNNWLTAHPYYLEIMTNAFAGLNISMLRLDNGFNYQATANFDPVNFQIVSNANQILGHPVPIFMDSWSPPNNLKNNGQAGNGTLLYTNGTFVYTNFASWWHDSLVAYASNGITPDWVSIQNEPDFSASYGSCQFYPTETVVTGTNYPSYSIALSNVWQQFSSLPKPPKLLAPEVIGIGYNDVQNFAATMNTNTFYGVANHLYTGGSDSAPDTYLPGMQAVASIFPAKPTFMTEYGVSNMVNAAWLIHDCLVGEGVSAYNFWSLVWPVGGLGLVEQENPWNQSSWTNAPPGTATQSHGYWLSPCYWSMKHFSYFIQPGFRRVDVTNAPPNVLASAYLSSNQWQLVSVLINNSATIAASVNFAPAGFTVAAANGYQTVGTNYWQPLGALGTSPQLSLPPSSLTTVVMYAPVTLGTATNPSPANGTTNVPANPVLAWTPGTNAAAHLVYFGVSSNLVATATPGAPGFAGVQPATNYAPGNLLLGTTYYWRVDETASIYTNPGPVWSFTTPPPAASFVLSNSDNLNNSSFNSTGNWTNAITGAAATTPPTNLYSYATGPFFLRTPASAGNYSFAGASLTVSPGGGINIKGGSGNTITFNNLILNGTINDSISPNCIAAVSGNLTVIGGALNVSGASGDNRAITNGMMMSGSGTLTNYGTGYVVYTGANSGFTGPLVVTNTTLQAASQAALGGNPPAFNPAQLLLDNGTFLPLASFALNNPNSGVLLSTNGGTFNIPAGVTLTVSNPIAGSGNCTVLGGGVLALAATNAANGNLLVGNATLAALGGAQFRNTQITVSNTGTLDLTALSSPFTVSNKVILAGTLNLDVNNASTNATSLVSAGSIVYGGTLNVSNTGPALAAGNTFQLFQATNYSGIFTNIPNPAGFYLAWNTNSLTVNGRLSVVSVSPPVITRQPAPLLVSPGTPAGFSVAATGGAALSYQWLFNGTNLPGATASNYVIAAASAANAGAYKVVLTNIYGSATSIIVTLTVVTNSGLSLAVAAGQPGAAISSTLFGAFFEDLNFAGEGGLYGELIRNRAFSNSTNADFWSLVTQGTATGTMSVDPGTPLNTNLLQSLKLSLTGGSGSVGAGNGGFWGLALQAGSNYNFSVYARTTNFFTGSLGVRLQSANGATVYAQTNFTGLTTNWQKFAGTLTSSGSDNNAQLVVSLNQTGTVWLAVVSLFPQATFNNRTNGLRPDLAGAVGALQPGFLRFPGGNFTEGGSLNTAFRWKTTLGDVSTRPGHWNSSWGYLSTDGLGFHEYLQFCEDIGATPLFDINCGMALNYGTVATNIVPLNQMTNWVQDALDAIQYANGATNTTWGALRAANGHPAPFNLQYLEIGNENGGTNYAARYALFYNAITNAYPGINLVADSWYDTATPYGVPTNVPVAFADEHHYASANWFLQNANYFDNRSRTSPHVMVGEYAVTSGYGTNGNLAAALGEAAFMTGLERNADLVSLASYAPLFANPNWGNWKPDAIYINNHQWFGTPSYYVQQMFGQNRGDVVVPVTAAYPPFQAASSGAVGVGTWNTQAAFSNLVVTASNGLPLFQSSFATQGTNGWNFGTGSWIISGGALAQTNSGTSNLAWTGSTTWSNYTFTLQAERLSGSEGFEILFNYQDASDYCFFNIGGWNNTSNAVQVVSGGGTTTVTSAPAPGGVSNGVWYNIQVTVNGGDAKCYLNGALVLEATNAGLAPVIASASYAQHSGQVIIKAVNPTGQAQTAQFALATTNALATNGTVTVLTSPNATDENSFFSPTYVFPATNSVPGVSTNFSTVLPANSLSIFRFQLLGAGAPQITTGPAPASVTQGAGAAFNVTATGTGPLAYQWSVDGTNGAGATNAAFTVTNRVLGIHPVAVSVTNLYGSVSASTTLTVAAPIQPVFSGAWMAGTNLVLGGSNGGPAGSPFYALYATNLFLPLSNWMLLGTNYFGPNGAFEFTNPRLPGAPATFFRLRLP